MTNAQWAMLVTGAVLALGVLIYGAWVAGESRGVDRRRWHRPLVVALGVLAGAALVTTAWMGV